MQQHTHSPELHALAIDMDADSHILDPKSTIHNRGGWPCVMQDEAEAEALELQRQLRSAGLLPAPVEIEAYLGGFDVCADRGQTKIE